MQIYRQLDKYDQWTNTQWVTHIWPNNAISVIALSLSLWKRHLANELVSFIILALVFTSWVHYYILGGAILIWYFTSIWSYEYWLSWKIVEYWTKQGVPEGRNFFILGHPVHLNDIQWFFMFTLKLYNFYILF